MKQILIFLILGILTLKVGISYGQSISVAGVVTDANGVALPAVTILEQGTQNGTITDEEGSYKINVKDKDAVLVVTYIGFIPQTIAVEGKTLINIILKEEAALFDEVVVLGYNAKKRNEIASSVAVISEKELKDVTTNNIGSMLQGKVPGLQILNTSGQPGAAPEIRIRGVSSVNAPQDPLYVVDGIIGGNFDPNDVASITVLKDAGATGMYGSQANGGVVIITTKQSKKSPMFEAKISMGMRQADQGNLHMMNGKQLYETQKNLYRSIQFNKVDFMQFYQERPKDLQYRNFDWLDETFQNNMISSYYLSARGSSGKMDYYLGGSYFNEGGTFYNTDFQRINLRANTLYHFTDKFKLTNNINLSGAKGKGYNYIEMYYSYLSMPWDNPYSAAGKVKYIDGTSSGWWSRDKVNPLHTLQNSDHPNKGYDVNYDLGLSWMILPWLSFTSNNRVTAGLNTSTNYYSPLVAGEYHEKGFVSKQNDLYYGGISTNLLRFNYDPGVHHNINLLVGFEMQGTNTEFIYAEGKGIPEGFDVLTVTSAEKNVSGSNDKTRMNSFISQLNYSLRDKYFLTGSYRIDGVSSFTPENRWAHFPSVSAAWLLSNESFLQTKAVDIMKLRASYGITGMQNIGAYRYLGLFSLSSQYNGSPAATPLQLSNYNLTWEKNNQLNFGIDFGLFKILSINFDYYKNTTKDLLVRVSQPLSVGFESRWENIGQVNNQGIEFNLGIKVINNIDFGWIINANIGKNSNEISGLKAPIITTNSWGITQIYRNGGSLYTFYLKKWTGVDSQTGLPTWEDISDEDGNPITPTKSIEYSDADLQEVGSALPEYQGGVGTSVRWKGLSLSASSAFIIGNKVYNNTRRFMDNDGHEPLYNQMVLQEGESRWMEPGDIATHPNMANAPLSTETSSRYIEKGDFFKIRNISLAYNLPSTFVRKMGLKGIDVAVSVDNPFVFTNYWGQDPETTITPGDYSMPGVSDFKYPNNRQYLGSITIQF